MGDQCVRALRDLSRSCNAHRVDGEAVVPGLLLILGDGGYGVGFAGGIQDADGLGLGLHSPDKLELGVHRQRVRRSGDVSGVQPRGGWIADGNIHHGNILFLCGGVTGHGRGRGHANHHIHAVGGKLSGDLGIHGVVETRVLVIHRVIRSFHQPGFLKPLKEALPAVVQGSMLAVLQKADLIGLSGGGSGGGSRCGRGSAGIAAGGKAQSHGGGQSKSKNFFHNQYLQSFHSN
ncbi:hypothetical protein SDC9_118919 [bioreactor metagenome]|uniref:Uncharacterized protein n=1 Tax=bioreactor metagenome TaxID=1076179 RepID=A0A645C414_9ZZZZ